MNKDTKHCPFCDEEIKANAIKCKHCLSMLDSTTEPPRSINHNSLMGEQILQYRLADKIGEGGMGTVYRAAHVALKQEVAIKVMHIQLAQNPELRERFIREAEIQIGLVHPAIVRVLTASIDEPHLALVMEYVAGSSLELVLERRKCLPLDEALPLFKQILSAVGYAHGQGVVHRDLKPSNIMVQANGTAKVMDFGIAKVLGSARLTMTGTAMGSVHYMSPEQVLGRKDIDHRTDIYSLGITLYEMLTGQPPFEKVGDGTFESDYKIKDAHVRQQPPDPKEFSPNLPDGVTRSLLKALEKKVDERFSSCEGFLQSIYADVEENSENRSATHILDTKTMQTPSPETPAPPENDAEQFAAMTTGYSRDNKPSPSETQAPPENTAEQFAAMTTCYSEEKRYLDKEAGCLLSHSRCVISCPVCQGSGQCVVCRSYSRECPSCDGRRSCAFCQGRKSLAFPGLDMSFIPTGSFLMGSPSTENDRKPDETQHEVVINRTYSMARSQVLQSQWLPIIGNNPSRFKGKDLPVDSVSWYDAVLFCNRLSALYELFPCYLIEGDQISWDREADGFRLPTEAEWEYCCRAGTGNMYYSGEDEQLLESVAWYRKNSAQTNPACGKLPNAWNIYDQHGNICEWCWDYYCAYQNGRDHKNGGYRLNPAGPATGIKRVFRGGSWLDFPKNLRSAARDTDHQGYKSFNLGFRVARNV